MKKTIKKIVAVATGAAMVGATIFGAAAASLATYPAPFVSNGVADVQFVIGSGATDDYIGVIDIATSLQAESVTEESVSTGSGSSASVEGGYMLEGSGSEPYLAFNESGVEELTSDDLETLLADGTVVDEDGEDASGDDLSNEEIDFDQTLNVNAVKVGFGEPGDLESPVLNLQSSGAAYNITVEFDNAVNFVGLEDGETLTIAGKAFTVGTDTTNSTLVLFGSDATTFLDLNSPKTITQDGVSYTVEIVGANSDADGGETVIIDVNGVRKTLEEEDSTTINGLDVYVKDLFVTNIPTLSASANVFVGSNEYKFVSGSTVDANGEDVDQYTFSIVEGSNFQNVTKMAFVYNMNNADNEEDRYVVEGESVVDPLFGTFALNFAGMSQELADEGKVAFMADVSSKDIAFSFENDDGDLVEFDVFDSDNAGSLNEDYKVPVGSAGTGANLSGLVDGDYFLATDGQRTSVFEVTGFDVSENEVTILDRGSDSESDFAEGKSVKDTPFVVESVYQDGTTNKVNLTSATNVTTNYIILKGGATVLFNNASINITEDSADSDESGYADAVLRFSITEDSDGQLSLTHSGSTAVISEDDENDDLHGITGYGTYFTLDEDGEDLLAVYTPNEAEVEYQVFVAPSDASVVISGGSGNVMTQRVNRIAIGSAVRDTDVNVANPAKNLIVVGGPCINAVAAELLGLESGACGAASGLSQNEATVQLFTLDNGKVAMLVAGWEATETQAAARAVASGDITSKAGEEATLTVTDARTYTIQ